MMSLPPPASTPIPPASTVQMDIPAQPATTQRTNQTPPPPPTPLPSAPPQEDLYDYQKCTVMVVLQIRPSKQADGPRQVLLGVQNGTTNREDLPLYQLLASENELGGPLPPAIVSLLEALQQDLPARKQRHEQRIAAKQSVTTATSITSAKQVGKYKKNAASATTAPSIPPVPTTNNPLPKDVVFGGIFDGL